MATHGRYHDGKKKIQWPILPRVYIEGQKQGLVKGEKFCFRNLDFNFWHWESTSTASQLSHKINKVPLLLQNLGSFGIFLRSWKKLVTTTVLNDFIGVFCLNLYLRICKAHWNSKNWQDLCFVLQTNRLSMK